MWPLIGVMRWHGRGIALSCVSPAWGAVGQVIDRLLTLEVTVSLQHRVSAGDSQPPRPSVSVPVGRESWAWKVYDYLVSAVAGVQAE